MTDQPGKLLHRGDGVRTAGDGLRSLPSSEIADTSGTGGLDREIGISRRQQRDLREGIEASEPGRECKSQITEGTARIGVRRSFYARFDCALGARDFEYYAMSSHEIWRRQRLLSGKDKDLVLGQGRHQDFLILVEREIAGPHRNIFVTHAEVVADIDLEFDRFAVPIQNHPSNVANRGSALVPNARVCQSVLWIGDIA
jgi:hypothetical protein